MQRDLDENEQLEVVAFLPLGKAITVESVGYENPVLVTFTMLSKTAAGTVRYSSTDRRCRFSSRSIRSHGGSREGS